MRRVLAVLILISAACGRATAPGDEPDANPTDPDAMPGRPDAHPLDAQVQDFSEVYAHSGTQLYRIDTDNLDVLPVGPFGSVLGNASMTDIAVDKDRVMVGISLGKIFSIDPDTGAASELAQFPAAGGGFTSLSFVPLDASDPDSAERLIAADDHGAVFEITYDLTHVPPTASAVQIGSYGEFEGLTIRSSGDIVSVRGVGTLATITLRADFMDTDYLAWIDTTTWAATPIGTATTGYDRIFGLGYWGGTIFGFVDNGSTAQSGSLVTIDVETGVATPATTSQFRWYGAGVTTKAPIVD